MSNSVKERENKSKVASVPSFKKLTKKAAKHFGKCGSCGAVDHFRRVNPDTHGEETKPLCNKGKKLVNNLRNVTNDRWFTAS